MPNQPAANLRGYLVHLDAEAKDAYLAACRDFGISGREAVQRFVAGVIEAKQAGRDWTHVNLEGDGSRVPALRPSKPAPRKRSRKR